jgi:hypothetical protein
MVRWTSPEKSAAEAAVASRAAPGRPKGIALSALALCALLAMALVRGLLALRSGGWAWSHPAGRSAFGLLQLCLDCGIGGLVVWHYWRGRSWARIAVLLWSVVTAVQTISFLADHNLDPASLMARPMRFVQALVALALLYWLNKPEVRAWFRRSSANAGELIGDRLVGRLCTAVEYGAEARFAAAPAAGWRLGFEHDAELILCCPWRIVLDDNLAFATPDSVAPAANGAPPPVAYSAARVASANSAGGDDELPPDTVPAPLHSLQEARRLLQNLRVTAVRVARGRGDRPAPRSPDLFVSFEMGIELQTWSAPASVAGSAAAGGGHAAPPVPQACALQWSYSDPALTVIAREAGVESRFAAARPEGASQAAER